MFKNNKFMQIILLLMGAGLLFLAVSGSFTAINNLLEGYQSQSWASVNGKIISSNINSSKTKNGYSYTPEVVYEYSVVQNVYTNKTIAFYFESTDSNNAGARASKYLTGSYVKVFYNPNSPSISCLEPGFFLRKNLGVWIISIFMGGIGFLFLAILYSGFVAKN